LKSVCDLSVTFVRSKVENNELDGGDAIRAIVDAHAGKVLADKVLIVVQMHGGVGETKVGMESLGLVAVQETEDGHHLQAVQVIGKR
jgi:hypothetical protein